MSFGESVFSVGFIPKTVKVDLHVRINCAYPQQNGHQKTLEDSRGLHTEAKLEWLPPVGHLAPRAHCQPRHHNAGSPLPPRLHLHHPLSWFDPRV